MRTCLICDDHALLRETLAAGIAMAWPDAEITEAGDFPTAWAAAAAHPDLIISDLVMPGATPLDGITRLRDAAPGSPVLVVTGNEDDATLLALLRIGVAGFAPKTSRSVVIDAAIRLVLAGGRYLPPRVMELALREEPSSAGGAAPSFASRLTERQTDILRLIASGQSNKEIARELDLSPGTIKAHAAAAMAALGATNRTEAVVRARELGLI